MSRPMSNIKWTKWNGQILAERIGFDTETDVNTHSVVLASASDGRNTYIISPECIGQFLVLHKNKCFVGWNFAYDILAIWNQLTLEEQELVKQLVCSGRMLDLMLLDWLVSLSEYPGQPKFRSLAEAAEAILGIQLDKSKTLRLGFAKLSQLLPEEQNKYLAYAATDAWVTYTLAQELLRLAERTTLQLGISNVVTQKWGMLTAKIQLMAAIPLLVMARKGVKVNQQVVINNITELQLKLNDITKELVSLGLIHETKKGPILKRNKVESLLSKTANDLQLTPPTTPTGKISISLDWWKHNALSPIINKLSLLSDLRKELQFVSQYTQPYVYPKYRVCVRTGRSSCYDPNIQQMPKAGSLRKAIIPEPGCVFIVADYVAIELCTLAQILLVRYARSRLAEVLQQGIDPHEYTACMMLGISTSELRASEQYKYYRQAAKAVNFGVPGGLGPKRLAEYARYVFGVELTIEMARQFRDKLCRVIYPELEKYLMDGPILCLAKNLKISPVLAWHCIDRSRRPWTPVVLWRTLAGEEKNRFAADRIWLGVNSAVRQGKVSPKVVSRVQDRLVGPETIRDVIRPVAVTLTGRARYTQSGTELLNTPFQGLAADGAKIALWELWAAGYDVRILVHDEIVVQVSEQETQGATSNIVKIMTSAMAAVCPDIPIRVNAVAVHSWGDI